MTNIIFGLMAICDDTYHMKKILSIYLQYRAEASPQGYEHRVNTGTRQSLKNRANPRTWGYRVLGYLRYVYAKRGVIAVATTYYLVLVTFLTAYTHPTQAVTVTIDAYDEAELELALMLLSLPAAARFLLNSLKHPEETPNAKTPRDLTGAPSLPLQPPPLQMLETSSE